MSSSDKGFTTEALRHGEKRGKAKKREQTKTVGDCVCFSFLTNRETFPATPFAAGVSYGNRAAQESLCIAANS
jgi:hypothetical protein